MYEDVEKKRREKNKSFRESDYIELGVKTGQRRSTVCWRTTTPARRKSIAGERRFCQSDIRVWQLGYRQLVKLYWPVQEMCYSNNEPTSLTPLLDTCSLAEVTMKTLWWYLRPTLEAHTQPFFPDLSKLFGLQIIFPLKCQGFRTFVWL